MALAKTEMTIFHLCFCVGVCFGLRVSLLQRQTLMSMGPFKVVCIGDGGVGKTTFFSRLDRQQVWPSVSARVSPPIIVQTTVGPIELRIWDTMTQEKFGGLRDAYYINADASLVFFDVSCRMSFKNVAMWRRDFLRVAENAEMVVVGNKADLEAAVRPK